ncbi:MAG: glycosyltransferase family 9 protein [Candidatus Zixiibacteriota bacterium]|nr:MAG: glycosyltransferase family 9 protein [candidate division Zixibacteria bacterium]
MKTPAKILVFRQSSLGDVILTLPVIKELSLNFPEADIDFLTKKKYSSIVEFNPAIRNAITFGDNAEFGEILKRIRRVKYDLIIDLQKNFRSLALSLVSPRSRKIGYKKRRLAREMIVRKPSINLSVDHTVNAYFHTLRRLGIKSEPSPPEIALSADAKEFAEKYISDSFPHSPSTIIALCPGAKHYEKKWPHEKFREVAGILLEDETNALVIISSAADTLPENLGLSHSRIAVARDIEILHVAALLSHCRVALTNDSGLMHLANAVGTRVAAIFGPTSPRLGFSPSLPGSVIISNNVFCSPCSLHGERPCQQQRKYCFENIEIRQVADIVLKML